MTHLLSLCDLTPEVFSRFVERGREVKREPRRWMRGLYEKTLLMIFEAPSLRTRMSFETAMTQLHGHAMNYYTVHSPWGVGKESIEDVARTISRYCDAVCARMFSHEELARLAEHASIPVINAMTNYGHPCQVLGDFMTIAEVLGRWDGVRIAYVGDGRNNVTYSLMRGSVLAGAHLVVGCPASEPYRPEPALCEEARSLPGAGRFDVVDDPYEAVEGADVVYTDSWMSYRVPADERERRLRDLGPYRVHADLVARASASAVFMHCLPAMRGDEVTAEVIDGDRSIVFDQAENRLHVEKAILLELMGR